MRRFQCLKSQRQAELTSQFSWLPAIQENDALPLEVKMLNVSVFDHWLSEREADTLLTAHSKEEQARRDSLFINFYLLMLAEAEVLSFVWRGPKKDQLRFRAFTSHAAALHYLQPDGSGVDYLPRIQLAIPQLSAIYYQGFDSTSHFYLEKSIETEMISKWALSAGLHVLS